MAILIGGSPSTGSSLLRRILNRHSEIFCGSESALFCKPALYANWHKNRHRLFRKSILGLKNAGWHHFVGLSLEEDYGYTRRDIEMLAKESADSFLDFVNAFYDSVLRKANKKIWAEKTPGNIFCFNTFSDMLPNAKLVHIVRHPQDCIASLTNRGMPHYQACVTYLLNTAHGLQYEGMKNLYVLKYEELVTEPEKSLIALFKYLDVDFETQVLEPDQEVEGTDYMEGWRYRESDSIASGSKGRFKALPITEQEKINSYISVIRYTEGGTYNSIEAIADELGYDLVESKTNDKLLKTIKYDRLKDMLQKTLKMANYNLFNYPFSINEK